MKIMVKYGLLALLLCAGTASFAQQDSALAGSITDRMKQQLSLSDDQYSQVYPVNKVFISAMQAMKTSGGGKLKKYKELKRADASRDQQLKCILTDEQYKTYLANKKKNRQVAKEAFKEQKKA